GAPAAVDAGGGALARRGEIGVKVAGGLPGALVGRARGEGVALPQLVGEMLAVGLEARRQRGARRPAPSPQAAPGEGRAEPGNEPRPSGPGPRPFRPNERGQGGRYHAIMEDRATFLEYVRGLQSGRPPRGP